jgi:hypothetical protein
MVNTLRMQVGSVGRLSQYGVSSLPRAPLPDSPEPRPCANAFFSGFWCFCSFSGSSGFLVVPLEGPHAPMPPMPVQLASAAVHAPSIVLCREDMSGPIATSACPQLIRLRSNPIPRLPRRRAKIVDISLSARGQWSVEASPHLLRANPAGPERDEKAAAEGLRAQGWPTSRRQKQISDVWTARGATLGRAGSLVNASMME